MAYYGHGGRNQPDRHGSYGYSSSNSSRYSHYGPSYGSYGSSHSRYAARAASPPPHPRRSSAYRTFRRDPRGASPWPPPPSVEDENVSLAREVAAASAAVDNETSDAASTRGSIDQYPIIQDIERPKQVPDARHDRRFVLVTDPDPVAGSRWAAREPTGKSFADRGSMPHLKTNVDDPPLFTQRTPSPYAYTKPQKESIAPSAGEYLLSPEPITPSPATIPRSVPKRDARDAQRDQNARPEKTVPIHSRYDSFTQTPRESKDRVFEDSDSDDTTYLRTERRPARYSFVKNDLQKEDLRTNLSDSQAKIDKERPDQGASYTSTSGPYNGTVSGSSKNPSPGTQSPRSSSSSLNNAFPSRQRGRPAPAETSYMDNSKRTPEMRPSRHAPPLQTSSPLQREGPPSPPRSPKLSTRPRADSPSSSRPSSRASPSRPASPLSFPTVPPPPSPRVPITEADWHATYPPVNSNNGSSPEPRFTRHESMPVPMPPRIDVKSPSPARARKSENPPPYPVDDRPTDIFMPPEEVYQFDHSYKPPSPTASMMSPYPDPPKHTQQPIPSSPRERPVSAFPGPSIASRYTAAPEELLRTARVRSNSLRSQSSNDGRRTDRRTLSLDRPMPSCPRSEASAKYDDWFALENCPNFHICPSCYNGVFADTPFSIYFRPVRRYDERFCGFSSPWMRLAWLLTIKQKRESPDLIYQLATIADIGEPCPKDREVLGGVWYGIADQRDGVHVTNFTVCPVDLKMLEALCPSIRGRMTLLPSTGQYGLPSQKYTCSLRTSSKRFPKYLDLLVELDEESRVTGCAPDLAAFIMLAREHAFKSECARDKQFMRRTWHYIPSLPEFTVCEECYDELIRPAIQRKNSVAKMFNGTTQLVLGEDSEGTSCCLYSPRMRRIWDTVLEHEDYNYLKRKAIARKKAKAELSQERAYLNRWLENMTKSGGYRDSEFDKLRRDLRAVNNEWKTLE